MQPEDLAT